MLPVPTPPSTTAGSLARRFGTGQLAGVEAGLSLAADLLAGDQDVRPRCADLLRRALKGLPAAVCARARVRADAGYFTAELAHAAAAAGRTGRSRRNGTARSGVSLAAVPETGWTRARGMPGAQVAVMDYAPAGWPPDAYTIVRRVKVDAADISADPRSRRRRTIPADQLALALDGELDHAYAVSFIVTNLPTSTAADLAAVEAWFRRRTDIEERLPRGQARRRAQPPAVRARRRQHGVDVGRAAGRGHLGDAANPDRDQRDQRHRPDGPAAPRAAARRVISHAGRTILRLNPATSCCRTCCPGSVPCPAWPNPPSDQRKSLPTKGIGTSHPEHHPGHTHARDRSTSQNHWLSMQFTDQSMIHDRYQRIWV